MKARSALWLIPALALFAAPVAAKPHYQLAAAGVERAVTERAVTEIGLAVTPDREWNVLSREKDVEMWTLDGRTLNELIFYGGIADGKTIWPDKATRDKPKPHYDKFAATMTGQDIARLYEATVRKRDDFDEFTLSPVEPVTFAGAPGFRFDYAYRYKDKALARHAEVVGAVIDRKLVMITFHTPEHYYRDAGLPAFRALVASARMVPPQRK